MDDRPGPSFDLQAGLSAALRAAVAAGLERSGRGWRGGGLYFTDATVAALVAMGLLTSPGWSARATEAGLVRHDLASGLWTRGVSLSVVGTDAATVVARWNGGQVEVASFSSPGEARRAVRGLVRGAAREGFTDPLSLTN